MSDSFRAFYRTLLLAADSVDVNRGTGYVAACVYGGGHYGRLSFPPQLLRRWHGGRHGDDYTPHFLPVESAPSRHRPCPPCLYGQHDDEAAAVQVRFPSSPHRFRFVLCPRSSPLSSFCVFRLLVDVATVPVTTAYFPP